jgi:tetratricopeptide (TPR) repeat protein
MQVVQGLAPEPAQTFRAAIAVADRALDLEPHSSLAMAIKGHALCHLGTDVEQSRRLLEAATDDNPNDPMAWLYRSVWSTMWGTPEASLREAEAAMRLSPLDPQRYYFEMMMGTCLAACEQWDKAIEVVQASLGKNRYHLPTIRTLMIAQYESGHIEEARKTAQLMLSLQPDLTVQRYLSSGGQSPLRQRVARAMAVLGVNDH